MLTSPSGKVTTAFNSPEEGMAHLKSLPQLIFPELKYHSTFRASCALRIANGILAPFGNEPSDFLIGKSRQIFLKSLISKVLKVLYLVVDVPEAFW